MPELPKAMLLQLEFDNVSRLRQTFKLRKAQRILKKYATCHVVAKKPQDIQKFQALSSSRHQLLTKNQDKLQLLPALEDACLPDGKLIDFLAKFTNFANKNKLPLAFWGSAGDGTVHAMLPLDLTKTSDRQKFVKLSAEYHAMVIAMNGTISARHGDGRLRGGYLKKQYGKEMYGLFEKTKHIFDPLSFLNPGVKLTDTSAGMLELLRHEYSLSDIHQHAPYL